VPADSPARGDRVEVPDVISALAPFLAGLGLFFTGVHFIAANLTPLVGRRFRKGGVSR
jgi:hypothetical protein